MFLDFSRFRSKLAREEVRNSRSFCKKLLREAGVALLPGSAFMRPTVELSTRMAFVDFDGGEAMKVRSTAQCTHEKQPALP